MKFFEFGKENNTTLMIFFGGGICWKGEEKLVNALAKKYHVIVDAYDGYNPDEPEKEYESTEKEGIMAAEFIEKNLGGHLDIAYAISYGGYILLDMLKHTQISVTTAIGDGMATFPYPNIKNEFLKKVSCTAFSLPCYLLFIKSGPLGRKIISKAMGSRSDEEFDKLLYRDCTRKTFYNQDYCMIGYDVPFEAMHHTNFYIWHGDSSSIENRLKKGVQSLKDKGYPFIWKEFKGFGHGGLTTDIDRLIKELEEAHAHEVPKDINSNNNDNNVNVNDNDNNDDDNVNTNRNNNNDNCNVNDN